MAHEDEYIDQARRDLMLAAAVAGGLQCLPAAARAGLKTAAHTQTVSPWPAVFARMPSELAALVDRPEHAIQLRWIQLRRDHNGRVATVTHDHGVATRRWFPAASVVKLPMALLMAEAVQACGGDADNVLRLHAPPRSGEWPADEHLDERLLRGIHRTFAVSDNPPFNRWYELLGGDRIHRRLYEMHYPNVRLISRLGSSDVEANRHGGGGLVLSADGRMLCECAPSHAVARRFPFGQALSGLGWQNHDGSVTAGPHDFSHANFLPLTDSLRMLQAFVLPVSVPLRQRWKIDGALRDRLLRALTLRPRESTSPVYAEQDHPDGYARWFFVGDGKARYPDELTVFGKSGMAYGSLSEVAYVVDRASGIDFMLAASISCNADGIYNDDKYEYDTVGLPFMAALARAVLAYEREQ